MIKKDIHDMLPMPPLEVEEGEFVDIQPIEPPDWKGLKILTPNKLLTRVSIL